MIKGLIGGVVGAILSFEWLRLTQQNGYKLKYCFQGATVKWLVTLFLLQCVTLVIWSVEKDFWWCFCVLWFTVGVRYLVKRHKVKFVFTKRMARLVAVVLFMTILLSRWLIWLVPVLSPFVVLVSGVALLPIEGLITASYCNKAKNKLSQYDLCKIAVVGSFGKTEVKHFACQLLPNCICTPNSVNTEKGVSAFINKTDFSCFKFAIFEMGAKKMGDVKTLCQMVQPDVGVFVGVSPCHMQTFKTMNNVIKEKTQLLHYLDKDSFCIMCQQPRYFQQYSKVGDCKKYVVNGGFLACDNFHFHNGTTTFDLTYREKTRRIDCKLLGKGAVLDLSMAVALGLGLGFDFDFLCQRAMLVESVPHRMQLLKGNGIYIIDDSYNANLDGVKLARETLASFDGAKFAITQGIAEGGKYSQFLNKEVGKALSSVCDHLFVVGKNQKDILSGCDGLAQVHLCQTMNEAVAKMRQLALEGDVVLFQNDLPD